ncbi:MAG: carboxyl transferase domain-containing protein [Actinophytocola sp.]|uniref:carboxyl transferase domain-containing protein n=1 Tax=Actinophytocola sp. TaxID=1872138 RepID=UPI003D6AF1AD
MTRTATSIEAAVAIAAQTSVEPDYRDPVHRMCQLLDGGSFEAVHRREGSGILVARGRIDGAGVVAYCTDGARGGGALGVAECPWIVEAIDLAVAENCPVVGVWHSGGAKPADGVAALDGLGQVYAAMVRASGRVPQLSLVLGPAAGGAAYAAALSDVVVMSEAGRLFTHGPDVVRAVTGEVVDAAGLGGPEVHGRSGVAHLTAGSEAAAYRQAREVVALLTKPGHYDLARLRSLKDPSALLPGSPRQAYDVHPLVEQVLDHDTFTELQAGWAANIVVGLGRLGGRTVGVVANNPAHDGGCLDSPAAEKAARFVRTCDAFGVPLVVVADVAGHLPGVDRERDGAARRDVKLPHAFAGAEVPRVTLVTRRAGGDAAVAMNSRALGATAVLAWPGAELAADMAVDTSTGASGLDEAIDVGMVDEVVDPILTRRRLAELLAAAPAGRGRHGNIPL